MNIRVVIVDDEPLAREGIALRLKEEDDIEIIAECGNGRDAIEVINTQKPDLVFLDINMPKISGFDVVKSVGPEAMPLVIFLTAYNEFAVKAFQINALDYLLKPINTDRFGEALDRARKAHKTKNIEQKTRQLSALLNDSSCELDKTEGEGTQSERLVIRSHGHVYFLRPADINWVEADGDYINIHTDNKRHMIRETMRNMEQKLNPYGFQRIHRSSIVKLECVQELKSLDSGEYEVVIESGAKLKLSRSYREAFFLKLKSDP
ncbi:MAG: two-component system LytT family response regulator [Flavobacteriales bacterium]|jgi:two-component system LytT family response regulator